MILERAYTALKDAGLDVRPAPLHGGVCSAPYCVVYEGACDVPGRSIAMRRVLAEVLVPAGKPGLLPVEAQRVRAAMEGAGFRCAAAGQTLALEDYRALSQTLDFFAPCGG